MWLSPTTSYICFLKTEFESFFRCVVAFHGPNSHRSLKTLLYLPPALQPCFIRQSLSILSCFARLAISLYDKMAHLKSPRAPFYATKLVNILQTAMILSLNILNFTHINVVLCFLNFRITTYCTQRYARHRKLAPHRRCVKKTEQAQTMYIDKTTLHYSSFLEQFRSVFQQIWLCCALYLHGIEPYAHYTMPMPSIQKVQDTHRASCTSFSFLTIKGRVTAGLGTSRRAFPYWLHQRICLPTLRL